METREVIEVVGGGSSWASLSCELAYSSEVILAVIADTAERYLSTPLFSQVSADMDEETG